MTYEIKITVQKCSETLHCNESHIFSKIVDCAGSSSKGATSPLNGAMGFAMELMPDVLEQYADSKSSITMSIKPKDYKWASPM